MNVLWLRAAVFVVACAGCGGRDSQQSAAPVVPPCLEARSAVAPDEQTSLDFTAAEVLVFVQGSHVAQLTWPDGSTTQVDFTVGRADPYLTHSEDNPDYTNEAGPQCRHHLQVDIDASFTTSDGQLNEAWSALPLRAYDTEEATAMHVLDVGELAGTYAPEVGGDQCLVSLQFNLTLAPEGFSGNLIDTVAFASCESITSYTGLSPREAGVWEPM